MRKTTACLLLLLLAGCRNSAFVPAGFEIPKGFATDDFQVRPITLADAEMDYEAVIESIDLIHATLLDDRWPSASFTLEENRQDMVRKARRFEKRSSFTYTVVSPEGDRVLGCVYINKGIGGPDAAVFLWVRQSAFDQGLDPVLEAAVRDWMQRDWPFAWVVYPGRAVKPSQPGHRGF